MRALPWLVARAGSVGRRVSMASYSAALAVVLSLGGCTSSHVETIDMDGDGYGRDVDCNDMDASIYPGADDFECPDGIDQDCDGFDGDPDIICNYFPIDADGDGYEEGVDCDDTDPATYPGAPEDCCEGIDRDCDGSALVCTNCFEEVDLDGDGYFTGGFGPPGTYDCDDSNAYVNPGMVEDCYDGIDNDCDGEIDEVPEGGCFIMNGMRDVPDDGQDYG